MTRPTLIGEIIRIRINNKTSRTFKRVKHSSEINLHFDECGKQQQQEVVCNLYVVCAICSEFSYLRKPDDSLAKLKIFRFPIAFPFPKCNSLQTFR